VEPADESEAWMENGRARSAQVGVRRSPPCEGGSGLASLLERLHSLARSSLGMCTQSAKGSHRANQHDGMRRGGGHARMPSSWGVIQNTKDRASGMCNSQDVLRACPRGISHGVLPRAQTSGRQIVLLRRGAAPLQKRRSSLLRHPRRWLGLPLGLFLFRLPPFFLLCPPLSAGVVWLDWFTPSLCRWLDIWRVTSQPNCCPLAPLLWQHGGSSTSGLCQSLPLTQKVRRPDA